MAYSIPATITLDKPILLGLDQSSSVSVHPVGYTVKSTNGSEFQFVYMESSGVTTAPGRPGVWVDTTGDYVVTPDCSDGAIAAVGATGGPAGGGGLFSGVFTMTNADVNACYLWVQRKGLVDGALVSTTIAVNDFLVVGNDDCFDDVQGFVSSVVDTYPVIVGTALTAATATGATSGLHSVASIMLF